MNQTRNPEIKLDDSRSTGLDPVPVEDVRAELQRILASRTFHAALGQKRFLAYTVEELIAGRAHLLKEYVIATEALGREVSFDPRLDPIVRTEARKLRARLAKYYQSEGAMDPLRVVFRKGSYVPLFSDARNGAPETSTGAVLADPPPIAPAAGARSTSSAAIHWRLPGLKAVLSSLVILVLAVSIAAGSYRLLRRKTVDNAFAGDDISIAVLPLVNLSGNNEEFLSEGLTDELIDSLTEVPGLRVVARTSAFRFKAKTLDAREMGTREIDQKLHIRAVLVGTFSKSENRLKVAVQLNNAANGYPLWSGSYERDTANIGKLPAEIAGAVTNVLGVSAVRGSTENSLEVRGSPVSDAQQDYLRGLYFRNKFTVDSLNKAIGYYKKAIAEDPSFARAYAGLADCYAMERSVLAAPPLEVGPQMKQVAFKALELDGKLGEPHIDLAISAEYEFDWTTAGREFKKGLELSPGNVLGHVWYAWYLSLIGNKDHVLTEKAIAARLDPVSPYAIDAVGHYYFTVGRYEAAAAQYRSSLALEPNFGLTHQDLGDVYLFQGMCEKAIEELRLANQSMPGARRLGRLGYAYGSCGHVQEARRILREFFTKPQPIAVPSLAIAEIYLGLGDKDQAFPWLEKAIDERDLEVNLKGDPHFQSLRSDPRFSSLLRRMKLT